MMLATMLFAVLWIAAMLAVGAMISTWRQYGSAWDALDAERGMRKPAPGYYVAIRGDRPDRTCTLVPVVRIKTLPLVDRLWTVRRAAA